MMYLLAEMSARQQGALFGTVIWGLAFLAIGVKVYRHLTKPRSTRRS